MVCAWRGCIDLLNFLLDRNANVNATDKFNKTALFYAIESENGENINIISMLLDHNSKVNHRNKEGETPLIVAVERGHTDTVKLLLDKRANPKVKNRHGEDIDIFAKKRNYRTIYDLLSNAIDSMNEALDMEVFEEQGPASPTKEKPKKEKKVYFC